MGAQGNTTIDFGAFPGASDASATITGQAGIVAGSAVEAWLRGEASADHSSDEHLVETIKVIAMNIVAGTGFTIKAVNTGQLNEPDEPFKGKTLATSAAIAAQIEGQPWQRQTRGGIGTRLYGVWNVSWVWN